MIAGLGGDFLGGRSFMTSVQDKTGPIRVWVVSIVLSIAFGLVSATLARRLAQDQKASGTIGRWLGDCRRTTNGGKWRSTTVASVRIRMTRVRGRTRRCRASEVARDSMLCSVAAAIPMLPVCTVGSPRTLLTASESAPASAWIYNFGQGSLNAQSSQRWREADGNFGSVCQGLTGSQGTQAP